MKKLLSAIFFLVFGLEAGALIFFATRSPHQVQDPIAINEVLQTVTKDFYALQEHQPKNSLDYVVLDEEERPLYSTRDGLSTSINMAVAHRDTLLDIVVEGRVVGKLIVVNDENRRFLQAQSIVIAAFSTALLVETLTVAGYCLYLHRAILRPFRKLKGFAERVAGGDLDIPLEMDRENLFGAFTESFDLMRSELRKARIAEAQATASKKELIARLSHDIKTPIASIKAVSEVALLSAEKNRGRFQEIIAKADQIDALISDLFLATLEELEQLPVITATIQSADILLLIRNADYLRQASLPPIPECQIKADRLRLQQVFDNIFSNSYKYARTAITVTFCLNREQLTIAIEDSGGGVEPEELEDLKKKFRRGSNSSGSEGAGLGLFICDHFLEAMGGSLTLDNGKKGLKAIVSLALAETI